MKIFFEEIWRAISDFKFYKEVKNFNAGKSVKYILSIVFLITLALTIRYSHGMGKGINAVADWMKKNLPVIEIKDGTASVNAEQPYKIAQDDFTVILDTTGKTTSLDGYKKGVLLMKDKVVYKENEVKTETYKLADVKALKIDENFMNSIRKNAVWIIFPFVLAGVYLYLTIARFLQILVFSLVTIFASAITKTQLTYKQIFNIGAYAATASMLLGGVVALFMRIIPGMTWVYCGLYVAYLIMGLLNCKDSKIAA